MDNKVDDIVKKFKSNYGEGEGKKYYTKFDVPVGNPPLTDLPRTTYVGIDLFKPVFGLRNVQLFLFNDSSNY